MNKTILAIHEASGQDITWQNDIAYSLVTGGGQTGTGISVYCGDTVGALCARDFKGVGNQYVAEGKLIIECRADID